MILKISKDIVEGITLFLKQCATLPTMIYFSYFAS